MRNTNALRLGTLAWTLGLTVAVAHHTAACAGDDPVFSPSSSDGGSGRQGAEGEACFANGTCVGDLLCDKGTCVGPEAGRSDVDASDSAPSDAPAGDTGDASADAGPVPTILAMGADTPKRIAVDTTDVYWTTNAAVMKCAISGCSNTPTVLADMQPAPLGIAVDATNVYWTNNVGGSGTVMTCAKGGCANLPSPLATAQNTPNAITVDATNVYWANQFGGTIMKCAVGGCSDTPTVLASDQVGTTAIAVRGSDIFWTRFASGTVSKCAVGGCADASVLASGQVNPAGVTTDSTYVYWKGAGTANTTVARCGIAGCMGVPTVIASSQGTVGVIATDGTKLYWFDDNAPGQPKRIVSCPITGCSNSSPPTVLALLGVQAQVNGMAFASGYLYWTAIDYPDGGVLATVAKLKVN